MADDVFHRMSSRVIERGEKRRRESR